MVFYFTSIPCEAAPEGYVLYMGKDKFENDDLIKHAWPEDVWFHVDKESSAHVYIRLPRGSALGDDKEWYKRIDPLVIEDCCQLVKANSIKGNKLDNVQIVFTPASNLKKSQGNAVGQVGFHKEGMVFKERVQTRKNEIVNRLDKTKKWEETNLEAELLQRNKEEGAKARKIGAEAEKERLQQEKTWKEDKNARSYDRLNDEAQMTTSGDLELDSDGEVDFM
mmetsp:Transcript_42998/g.97822  ORF Transcript_42998/g.97822 Transcript_42998/m.97822 type:complete len:222 (+) Transcript_42998:29-694(+)